jgi:hypothetical protein
MPNYDFSTVPGEAIKELHRQGEMCLQGTVQLAIASDQRASTLTGILGASSVALTVAAGNAALVPAPHVSFAIALGVTALFVLLGTYFCAHAARSIDYHLAGYEPYKLAIASADETWLLRFAAEDVQKRIDFNRKALDGASRDLTIGRWIALLAMPIGVASYFLVSFPPASLFLKGVLGVGLGG